MALNLMKNINMQRNLARNVLTFSKRFSSVSSNNNYDVIIAGGGILGTATARELSIRYPKLRMMIVEKEDEIAKHQSGRNSGVIHAGIYYVPGSLKAKLCVNGLKSTYDYCEKKNIPFKRCGKLIVALNEEEEKRLIGLYERGLQNNCPGIELVDSKQIQEIEPNCVGVRAIWSPNTGIVHYKQVSKSFAEDFLQNNGQIKLNFQLTNISILDSSSDSSFPIKVSSKNEELNCRYLITCGGLHADKLASMTNCNPEPKIVPFRGEYLLLKPEKRDLVHTNIYPVPDPKFPFLGVHFTPRVDGDVWLGPNAVLAAKREGYSYTDINLKEFIESISYRGFQQIALRNVAAGIRELQRSIFISCQVNQLKKYVPKLKISDVIRGPAGVRAQALDSNGKLVDDFLIDGGQGAFEQRVMHVRNAPSPAATSSQEIAKMIADDAASRFQLVNS